MTVAEKHDLELSIDSFSWASEEQKQGYLAFVKYVMDKGQTPPLQINEMLAWLIQKDHESYEWIRDTFGNQISSLQDEIKRLLDENVNLRELLTGLNSTIKQMTLTMELMASGKAQNPQ